MEVSQNQKLFLFKKLGKELEQLRQQSQLSLETIGQYANIKQSDIQKYEAGSFEFGVVQIYLLMQWAAVFGKKLNITLEDFTQEERLENYELVKRKLLSFNRSLCG